MRLLNKQINTIVDEMNVFISNEIDKIENGIKSLIANKASNDSINKKKKLKREIKQLLKYSTLKIFEKEYFSIEDITTSPSFSWRLRNLYKKFSNNSSNKIYRKIKNEFTKKILTEIKHCPYCWKSPLYFTLQWNEKLDIIRNDTELTYKQRVEKINDQQIIRSFDFEHIFNKALYGKLAINFYNIIPTCISCNQRIKWTNDLYWHLRHSNKKIFHPYLGWLKYNQTENRIDIEPKEFWKSVRFTWKNSFKGEHSKFFELKEIYFFSQDTDSDIKFLNKIWEKAWCDRKNANKIFNKEVKKKDIIEYLLENYYPKNEEENLDFANWIKKRELVENLIKLN